MSRTDGAAAADELTIFKRALLAYADEEYCRSLRMFRTDPCLGWEAKVKSGKFGAAEYAAHQKANEHMGAHRGIYAAVKAASLAAQATAIPQPATDGAPVAHVNMRTRSGCGDGLTWTGWALPHGTPLYAAPPAALLRECEAALDGALREYERNTCHHEETHRGGAIWTICDWCGAKWADDRGGFKPYEEPLKITAAYAALANLREHLKDAAGVDSVDDWQQYAKDGETAQACIERHRREQDGLIKLLAHARGEPLPDHEIIALLPAGWTGMLAQVMEFARRIERARGVDASGKYRQALHLIAAVEDRFGLEKAREIARECLASAGVDSVEAQSNDLAAVARRFLTRWQEMSECIDVETAMSDSELHRAADALEVALGVAGIVRTDLEWLRLPEILAKFTDYAQDPTDANALRIIRAAAERAAGVPANVEASALAQPSEGSNAA